jgi:hypothetical protein
VDVIDGIRAAMRRHLRTHVGMTVADLAREVGVVDQTLSRFIDEHAPTTPRGVNLRRIQQWADERGIAIADAFEAAEELERRVSAVGSLTGYRLGEIAGQAKAVRRMLVSALDEQERVILGLEQAFQELRSVPLAPLTPNATPEELEAATARQLRLDAEEARARAREA